jgi:ankyrin repeat protein
MLVSRGADVNAQDVYRDTPLHTAVAGGHFAGVVALLEAGADVHTRDGSNKRTPLYLAAWCNHPEIFEPLVAAGADTSEAVRELLADASRSNIADGQKNALIDMVRRLEALPSASQK